MILNEAPECWPVCDALLSFFSSGFPLEKAISYAQLRQPFIVNDLEEQIMLQDRIHIHKVLASAGVDVPKYEVRRCSTLDDGRGLVLDSFDLNQKCVYYRA